MHSIASTPGTGASIRPSVFEHAVAAILGRETSLTYSSRADVEWVPEPLSEAERRALRRRNARARRAA